MHWIIQSNLVASEDVDRLRQALDRLDTSYTDVKLIPIVRTLDHVPVVEGPVFVYGSTFVHRAAYDQGWWPGYIGGTHTYEEIAKHYGEELLNDDVRYERLSDLVADRPVFVRPKDDGKLFTGLVVDSRGLDELRTTVIDHAGTDAALDEVVVVSSPKRIQAEHRCLVVNGRVVCASTYRRGSQVVYDGRVDENILQYAQSQVDRWQPDLGFALDVAQTSAGLRIVEINALSSSGLYACDLMKFADAVNGLGDLVPRAAPSIRHSP